jgi:hypothetical protein
LITRRLGYPYLWIDSLCIIQDDQSDWEKECQKMCTVFENSSFTISALRAGDGFDGLLNKREIKPAVPIRLAAGGMVSIRQAPVGLTAEIRISPMNKRGWILQERLLSPGLLHFGHRQMYWECCSHTASESRPNLAPHTEGRVKYLLIDAQRNALQSDSQDPYLLWYKIVDIYMEKELTIDSDRLAAILGLADRFYKLSGAGFLAGLWFEDLHRGLLWMRKYGYTGFTSNSSSVPSWSWIKCNGGVAFEWVDFPHNTNGPHNICPISREPTSVDLEIVDANISTRLPSSTQTTWGFIQAWGVVVRVQYQTSNESGEFGQIHRWDQPQLGSLPCQVDFECDKIEHCYCLIVSDWVFEYVWDGFFGRKHNLVQEKQRCYLVLSRAKRPPPNRHPLCLGEFRRIGVGATIPSLVQDFFRTSKKRFLTIV